VLNKLDHERHRIITSLIFGDAHPDVHRLLDELFPKYRGFGYWKERHHSTALEAKYGKGKTEYMVGVVHIICDWLSHLNVLAIPQTSDEVLELLDRELNIQDTPHTDHPSEI